MTKWFVIETHLDAKESKEDRWGPFQSLDEAVYFVKTECVPPWSDDTLSEIAIRKETTND